jgi:hypothetical protein
MQRDVESGGSRSKAPLKAALLLSLVCASGVACAHRGYVYVEAPLPPPPPRAEVIVETPGSAFVWVPGHWRWRDGGYLWVRGAWRRPPRYGAVWVEPRYEQREGRWVFVEGFWRY